VDSGSFAATVGETRRCVIGSKVPKD